jgi:predicted short-subunit dehydrogenase-like oxidoreductase (DUF2520 family)
MEDPSAIKDIVLIGTGHAATVLGRLFRLRGYRITQVFGRDRAAAAAMALELDAESVASAAEISQNGDLCLVSISDVALYEIGSWMPRLCMPVAHTAGSVPIDVLAGLSSDYGVLYPLQSLRSNQSEIPEIPFLVEGNTRRMEHMLRAVGRNLSGMVSHAGDEERRRMHLAAVFTSNFFNHLCTLAEDYCTKEGMDFRMLLPLLEETVSRMETEHPGNLQTGPALRGDQPTIDRHLEILRENQAMWDIYAMMSTSIQQYYKLPGR